MSAGRSGLLRSGNFSVGTRLGAAVIAADDGVCSCEAQINDRSMLATIKRCLDMACSDDRSRDDTRKLGFPNRETFRSLQGEIGMVLPAYLDLMATGRAPRTFQAGRSNVTRMPS